MRRIPGATTGSSVQASSIGTALNVTYVDTLATGGAGTSGSPWTGWETALNALPVGARIVFRGGTYTQAAQITPKVGWYVSGYGMDVTIINITLATGASGWLTSIGGALNALYVTITDLQLNCTNAAHTGAALEDIGGQHLVCERIYFAGQKYATILDGTEISAFRDCIFALYTNAPAADLWITGKGLRTSSQGANALLFERCDFNGAPVQAAIESGADSTDGGSNINFLSCNFEGNSTAAPAIRLNRVDSVTVDTCYFELQNGAIVTTNSTTLAGGANAGSCHSLVLRNNHCAPLTGNNIVALNAGLDSLVSQGNRFITGSSGTACLSGLANAVEVFSAGDVVGTAGAPLTSGNASQSQQAFGESQWKENTVGTFEGTASTAYTDLTTPGPAVTVIVPSSGSVKITLSAFESNSLAAGFSYMSVALSGGNTLAASDANAVGANTGTANISASFTRVLKGLTPGSTVFTAKYRATSGTANFANRELIVEPMASTGA